MFCEKYEKVMKVLNGEIELTHDLFLEALELAKTARDESDKKAVLIFAKDCNTRFETLKELKNKIRAEVEA